MKKQTIATVLLTLLILLTIAFIFENSARREQVSSERSTAVAEAITPIPRDEYEKPSDWSVFIQHVRKTAHAVEFFVLGLELSALFFFVLKKNGLWQRIWNALSILLAVAVTDESIQILSKRGPKVEDVLLDFCGAAVAAVLALLIYGLVYWRNKRKLHRKGETLWK